MLYLAGFFDGEGSVGIYRRGQGRNLHSMSMTVVQNHTPVTEALFRKWRDVLGGSLSLNRSASGNSKLQWQASGITAEAILRVLLPYVVLKREQVELCLLWQEIKPVQSRGANGRIVRVEITDEMRGPASEGPETRYPAHHDGASVTGEVVPVPLRRLSEFLGDDGAAVWPIPLKG